MDFLSFIDNWYNNHSLHGSSDYLTPIEYKEKRKLGLGDSESKNSYEFFNYIKRLLLVLSRARVASLFFP